MPSSTFSFESPDGTQITAYRWDVAGEPRAAVQLTVDAYLADPYCGFGIDTESTQRMFAGARRLADPSEVAAMRSALPVYIAVGEADPVNGGLALLAPLTDRYTAAGLADVTVRTYPGARHEILNETNRAEVIGELTSWLDRVAASGNRG